MGTSHWIKWELSQISSKGYVSKTVFLFPASSRSLFGLKRKMQQEQFVRIGAFSESLRLDPPLTLTALEKQESLLACVAIDNVLSLITCKKHDPRNPANVQFLAAIVGHSILEAEAAERGSGSPERGVTDIQSNAPVATPGVA